MLRGFLALVRFLHLRVARGALLCSAPTAPARPGNGPELAHLAREDGPWQDDVPELQQMLHDGGEQRMLSKMVVDHLQRALPWSSKPAAPLRAVAR